MSVAKFKSLAMDSHFCATASGRVLSQVYFSFHMSCRSSLALTDTGLSKPRGSNILDDSCRIRRFVISSGIIRLCLGNLKVSLAGFHLMPRTLALVSESCTISLVARVRRRRLFEVHDLRLKPALDIKSRD